MSSSVLKSVCLPGGICVSYCNSPELASRAFFDFVRVFPSGASFKDTVGFFEQSSAVTGNDYIIAFAATSRLVTVRNGHRLSGLSKTHWIGDKEAFSRYREYESKTRRRYLHGRASNSVLFADEMDGSPASHIYSFLSQVSHDPEIASVGGFVSVISSRGAGFRYSVYSDVLFDWPRGLSDDQEMSLSDKIDLASSGENDRYSVSQIASQYLGVNAVIFYALSGGLLVFLYMGVDGAMQCKVVKNIEPAQLCKNVDLVFGEEFHPQAFVFSSRQEMPVSTLRQDASHGLRMSLYCELNTMSSARPGASI